MFVLVVGAGRVGSSVATSALRAGHTVSVLDEDPLSHERLDVELGSSWEESGGRFTIGTALEMDALAEAGIEHLVERRTETLSAGELQRVCLASVLALHPALLLLDEPARGLDYASKSRLVTVLRALASEGHAIVLATHDVELAAEPAHRVVTLAEGEVVAGGPTA